MDRRSWLWRRKSSEKSPNGETDSSESVSSHSERVSDELALSFHNINSPEVTSKQSPTYDELLSSVKILSSKLSESLRNIDVKEELVKQHAKVAEEAVSGWEKAENEALLLKKQLDVVIEKNSSLEERIGQLDGALKECLRQLRQAREDQEQRVHEAVESAKIELKNRIIELESMLENTETDCIASTFPDLWINLEALERENSELRFELLSLDEELKRVIFERDLSVLGAETASKQYLESRKKVAKLESECRKLTMLAHRDRPVTGSSSVYSGSICEDVSRYDGSHEIDLMDDFLEMERFAALPAEDKNSKNDFSKAEFETLTSQTAELDEKLKKSEEEKVKLKMDLVNCQEHLKALRVQMEETLVNLIDLQSQLVVTNEAKKAAEAELDVVKAMLEKSTRDLMELKEAKSLLAEDRDASNEKLVKSAKCLAEAEVELVELRTQLFSINASKCDTEAELVSIKINKEVVESRLDSLELENHTLQIKIRTLEDDLLNEHNLSLEAVEKCLNLNDEISSMKAESQVHNSSIRFNQDKVLLATAASKFEDCQKTIASLDRQLKSLAVLEDVLIDSEMSPAIVV